MALALFSFHTFADTASKVQKTAVAQQQDLNAINSVIEDFRISIINKDKNRFSQLFYAEDIPWLGVLSDASLEMVQVRKPDAKRVDSSNYLQFIDWIVSDKRVMEEKFWNVDIQTERNIASVHFDYSFHMGDYKSNWGQEGWHLIKTEQGWKINSVIYSMTLNPNPPKKKTDK